MIFGERPFGNQAVYSEAREKLVESIRCGAAESGIDIDPDVLATLARIPRERFLPRGARGLAYEDRAVPIRIGQTLSQPTMIAWMTSLLGLTGYERVLEVGTGSGYQAYVLSLLLPRGEVITIERHAPHARRAARRLRALGASNVRVVIGDGSQGYPEEAPFQRILVTAGSPSVPFPLIAQLADGGRLVAPIGGRDLQELITVDKDRAGNPIEHSRGRCQFVPLVGFDGWAEE